MTELPFSDEDLSAYLDGKPLPALAAALPSSPALQARLEQMRLRDQQLQQAFVPLAVVQPQDLVDVATNQASPAQRERVLRLIQHDAALQEELALLHDLAAAPPVELAQPEVPLYLAVPTTGHAAGIRSLAPEDEAEQYLTVAALDLQLQLATAQDNAGLGQIDLWLTENYVPLAGVAVVVQAATGNDLMALTDDDGAVQFAPLAPDTYQLLIRLEAGEITLPPVVFHADG